MADEMSTTEILITSKDIKHSAPQKRIHNQDINTILGNTIKDPGKMPDTKPEDLVTTIDTSSKEQQIKEKMVPVMDALGELLRSENITEESREKALDVIFQDPEVITEA